MNDDYETDYLHSGSKLVKVRHGAWSNENLTES
jgi:hypothetical protein